MPKLLKLLNAALLISCIAFVGCPRKATKVEPEPEPAPVEEPQPEPEPPEEDVVFEAEDMDAQLREVLQPIYFEFDRYDLEPSAISKLERIAAFLKEHPDVRILAQGHTDERGSSQYNIGLGENRANAVKNYLTGYGVSSNRIETTSYGEEQPANPNCGSDDQCHTQNRRVEWQVLAK